MKNSILTKMQKTWAGRTLARLVGEDAGAVMMEYVILAVLIAAAAVVAIAYFGRTVVGETNIAVGAMSGRGIEAADMQEKMEKTTDTYTKGAATQADRFSSNSDATEKFGSGQ